MNQNSFPDTLERDDTSREFETGSEILTRTISDINTVEGHVEASLGLEPDSFESVIETDKALVSIAEHEMQSFDSTPASVRDVLEDVALRSAEELDRMPDDELTPAAQITRDGYGDELESVAHYFNEHNVVLPSGHEAGPLVLEAIHRVDVHASVESHEVVALTELGAESQGEGRAKEAASYIDSMRSILTAAGYAKEDYEKKAEITSQLAVDDELTQAMLAIAQVPDVDGWDALVVRDTLTMVAAKREALNTKFSFSGEVEYTDAEAALVAEDERTAQNLRELLTQIPGPKDTNLLKEYGAFSGQGVSVEDAEVFDKLKGYSTASVEDIKGFAEAFANASPATQRVLEAGRGLEPQRVMAIDSFIAEATKKLEPEAADMVASRLATDLGAGGYVDAEMFQQKVAAMHALVNRSGDVVGISKLYGQSLESVLSEDMSEQSKQLMAAFSRNTELELDGRGTDIMRLISERPDDYVKLVEGINQRYEGVIESGYPASVMSQKVDFMFGPYAMNNIPKGLSLGEWYNQQMNEQFDAMELIGDASFELAQLSEMSQTPQDRYRDWVVEALRNGESIDKEVLRSNLEDARDVLAEFARDDEALYRAVARVDVLNEGDARKVAPYLEMARTIAPDLRTIQDDLHIPLDQSIPMAFAFQRSADFAREQGRFGQDFTVALENYKTVTGANEALSKAELHNLFLAYSSYSMDSFKARDVLLAPEITKASENPNLARQINYAMGSLVYAADKYDFNKDIAVITAIGNASPSYLSEMVLSEAKLTQEDRAVFHEHAEAVLTRRDKDGNLYDPPEMLALAVEQHASAEELNWFTSSELPVAAYRSVVEYRLEAAGAGVEDTPRAIYEWIHRDPEKAAELSGKYLREYVDRLGPVEGFSVEEQIEKARELSDRMKDDFRVFVNISPDSLQLVDEAGGALKSTLDALGDKKDYASQYLLRRSGIEVALGVRSLDGGNDHPVYGSAGYVGDGVPLGAIGYGEVMLAYAFDDEMDEKTSFTPEDSFHGPQRLTSEDARLLRILKSARGHAFSTTKDYVEAQVMNGLQLDKVSEVYVSSADVIDTLPDLLKAKARVRTSGPMGQDPYGYTREKQLLKNKSATSVQTL